MKRRKYIKQLKQQINNRHNSIFLIAVVSVVDQLFMLFDSNINSHLFSFFL